MGTGDDKFTGGNAAEVVKDGVGADTRTLVAAMTFSRPSAAKGTGWTRWMVRQARHLYGLPATHGLIINLDKVDHVITNYFAFNPVNPRLNRYSVGFGDAPC
ncbi:MAG: hypothetical protein U1E15_13125 [Hyphomicrobiales bacterium]